MDAGTDAEYDEAPRQGTQSEPGVAIEDAQLDDAAAAQEQVRSGIYLTAVRCLLTYVLIPGVSATGALAGLLGVAGLGLQLLGAAVSTFGAIKLWQLRHRARFLYGMVTGCVYAATILSVVEFAAR